MQKKRIIKLQKKSKKDVHKRKNYKTFEMYPKKNTEKYTI